MGEWLTGKIPNEEARDANALHGDVEVEVGGLPGLQVDVSGEDPEGGRSTGGSSWVTEEGILMTDYAKLRALAEAATPGEWRIEIDSEESYEGGISYSEWTGTLIGPENAIPSRWAIARGETNRIAEISELRMEDAAYIAAANPQTMIALLDERDEQTETIRLFTLTNEGHLARIVRLQARIDAALRIIHEHSVYGVIPPASLIEAALVTPTENGEEQ